MRRFAVLGLLLAAALVALSPGSAAAADTVAAAGVVEVYLPYPGEKNGDPRDFFLLHVYPQWGVASVTVSRGTELSEETLQRNSFAIAIPKQRFEGSIDLKFPGLGEVSGQIRSSQLSRPELPAQACDGGVPSARATFEGRFSFRGLGDRRTWTAQKAEGSIKAECGAPSIQGKSRPEVLFDTLAEFRPIVLGPSSFRFFSAARPAGRVVEFTALGRGSLGTFLAIDKEWLPGDVAAERVVSTTTRSFGPSIEVGPGGEHPQRIAFTPPAPFFGAWTVRRFTCPSALRLVPSESWWTSENLTSLVRGTCVGSPMGS